MQSAKSQEVELEAEQNHDHYRCTLPWQQLLVGCRKHKAWSLYESWQLGQHVLVKLSSNPKPQLPLKTRIAVEPG